MKTLMNIQYTKYKLALKYILKQNVTYCGLCPCLLYVLNIYMYASNSKRHLNQLREHGNGVTVPSPHVSGAAQTGKIAFHTKFSADQCVSVG